MMTRFLNWYKYQESRLKRSRRYSFTREVLRFLEDPGQPCIMSADERKAMASHLRRTLVGQFNVPFELKYRYRRPKIVLDRQNGLHYAVTAGNQRLYFKRGIRKRTVRLWYNNLCMEQDDESPHNYCFNNFTASDDTIIADIGAAEANFTLRFIEKIKKAYLFESDPEWIEAMEASFRPWKDKVLIVKKFVSDKTTGDCVTLDAFFANHEKPTVLKIDVEGEEQRVLASAGTLLAGGGVSDILACTYHRENDAETLSRMLEGMNYETAISPGYMLLTRESGFSPSRPFDFRKTMLHGRRKA
jgi:hypothetical protein